MIRSIKNSILLSGSFFDQLWEAKIDLIIEKINPNTFYFFDHTLNPQNSSYSVYKQFDAINKVLEYKTEIRLGTLVTNLKRTSFDEIHSSLNSILSLTNNFDLGIGIGDSKYEKDSTNNNFNIDESIESIINKFTFDKECLSIFIGGVSEYVQSIAVRYDLGMNIWNKDQNYVGKKFKDLGIKNRGRNSFTVRQGLFGAKGNSLSYCDEIIFVIKDSSFDEFTKQLDNIKGWIET